MERIDEKEFKSCIDYLSLQALRDWLDEAVRNGATHITSNTITKLTAYGTPKKKLLTPERALELFGDPKNQNTYKWMRLWTAPQDLAAKAPGFPTRIYMHIIAVPLWEKIYAKLIELHLIKEIYSIGWYNVRPVSGTNRWSLHSWALGPDINPADNPRGTVGKINAKIVELFEFYGFNWGGRWSNSDPMHFELSQEAVDDFLAQQSIAIDPTDPTAEIEPLLLLPNADDAGRYMPEELRQKAAALAQSLSDFESSFNDVVKSQNC